jgi:hypothetical protein
MASADFCRLMLRHSLVPRFQLTQISPGKNADLHPMYLPHLPPCVPGSGRALFWHANSPTHHGLICDFCSSGRDFAADFLQIPIHNGHPCLWLILLAAKRIADSHRRVCAHAGRTNKGRPAIAERPCPCYNTTLLSSLLTLVKRFNQFIWIIFSVAASSPAFTV